MKCTRGTAILVLAMTGVAMAADKSEPRQRIDAILAATEPLPAPRGERMPLLLWPTHDLGVDDEAGLRDLMTQLAARGVPAIAHWRPDDPASLERALLYGRLQQELGMPVVANATSCLYSFFDGDPRTAYHDDEGEPYFDDSFGEGRPMGNPFSLEYRIPAIRARIQQHLDAYQEAGITVDIVFGDWEIDGPIEWNGGWDSARRDPSVRARVGDIDDFAVFQAAMRQERSRLQRLAFAEPVRAVFPEVLVGNYAVYPHDGWRYWYDFFETLPEGAPSRGGRAHYRPWYDEFPLTGYTFAMPTVYPWADIHGWYDFAETDYRWAYNMLKVGSNAGAHTPAEVPIITFVHAGTVTTWTTTEDPGDPMSQDTYREVLWHLLLRGHDALFMWSGAKRAVEESVLVYEVYRESHAYADFLVDGQPVVFELPETAGPVVSALRLGDRLLVRRTDFGPASGPLRIEVAGRSIEVPAVAGSQVLSLR